MLICGQCGANPSFERLPWPQIVNWSPDGRYFYMDLFGTPYAIPLQRPHELPRIPKGGFKSDQDVAALPGARRIPQEPVFPGPRPDMYAFTRISIQRTIYRVPVP